MDPTAKQPDEEWGGVLDTASKESEDLVDVLGRVGIFEGLSNEELRQIERIVHRRTYRPQETIVRQGAPGVGMYIIQSGAANVLLESEDGQVIRLAELRDGQFFGEMSLLDASPRSASVAATERSRIIGFFRADLMDLIAHSPQLGFRIVFRLSQLMEKRLRETMGEYRSAQRTLWNLQDAEDDGEG